MYVCSIWEVPSYRHSCLLVQPFPLDKSDNNNNNNNSMSQHNLAISYRITELYVTICRMSQLLGHPYSDTTS